MQKQADIKLIGQTFFITGELNLHNVTMIYEKSLPQLKKCKQWNFNFSQLVSGDSAGFALIIEWIKLAKYCNKPIRFVRLSDDLLSIAKVAGITELINNQLHDA